MTTATKRTLFQISDDLLALEDLLSEVGGDVTDEQAEEAIMNWFAELGDDRDEKLDGYVTLIAEFEARAEMRKREAQRIAARARVDESSVDRLKERLKVFFQVMGLKTVETDLHRITLANNGGKLPLVLQGAYETDATLLPDEFQKKIVTPDKDLIRKKLEAGEMLEFASLGDRGQGIRIK